MIQSASPFNVKNLPLAALIAIVVAGAAEYLAHSYVHSGKLELPRTKRVYREVVKNAKAQYRDESLILLGNSRAVGIIPYQLSRTLYGDLFNEVYSLTSGGAMPATQMHILDALNYACIKEGHTVVFCLTPMCFNKNNLCFKRTIQNFYSLREFFSESVRHLRIEDILFFIGESGLHLLRYGKELSRDIKEALFGRDTGGYIDSLVRAKDAPPLRKADKRIVNEGWVERIQAKFETEFYVDYTLDTYQIEAVREVLSEVEIRGGHCVLVMLPLPSVLRELLGEENVRNFTRTVIALAREEEVPLLDYVSGYAGNEYDFFDGSHLTVDSRSDYTLQLARDLKTLNAMHGFPVLDIPVDKDNRTLTADLVEVVPGRDCRITFELTAGKGLGLRPYTLLGSMSGISPGEYIGNLPFPVPVNWDIFTDLLVSQRNQEFVRSFKGFLDSDGRGEAVLVLPGSFTGVLEGRSLWFAYVVRRPVNYASNAVRIDFVD